MVERTLSQRALNRALLARQLLLERADLPPARAVERLGGLQTQYAPSPYIGLWSRLEGFQRDSLTRALERRTVIQGTLMRNTIHMVSRRDYAPIVEGVRATRRADWLRATRHAVDARRMASAARRVRSLLADGPRKRKDIQDELGIDTTTWNGVGLWVDLVRVPPSGTWEQRRADLFGLAESWLGPSSATAEEGVELLVRRYFGAFGPASRKDFASWAGLHPKTVDATLEGIGLRRFRSEAGEELLDLPRAPLPDPSTPAPVRFLPTWDATLLVHARRSQILPEQHRPRVFHVKTPHSVPTFLVDGRVAGAWRFENERVSLDPFEPLPRATRRRLDDEADRLALLMS